MTFVITICFVLQINLSLSLCPRFQQSIAAECSGKFKILFLPFLSCIYVLSCGLSTDLFAVCLRTYLQYTYVLVCSILMYLFAVYLRTYMQYTYVFICSILTYLFAVFYLGIKCDV